MMNVLYIYQLLMMASIKCYHIGLLHLWKLKEKHQYDHEQVIVLN